MLNATNIKNVNNSTNKCLIYFTENLIIIFHKFLLGIMTHHLNKTN
jgi:hypothetical protein